MSTRTSALMSSPSPPAAMRPRADGYWPLEDHHVRRCAPVDRHDRANGARRADDRRVVPCPHPAGVRADARVRRRRDPRQPARTQERSGARSHRGSWRAAPVPAALQPDFNPIENAFAKLKTLLRKAAARTVEHLWRVIGDCLDAFTPIECANYFAAAGYDAY